MASSASCFTWEVGCPILRNHAHFEGKVQASCASKWRMTFDPVSSIYSWSEQLSLNRWHWMVGSREGREGRLQVDGGVPVTRKSPPTLSELNLELSLFIGGIPDENVLQRELRLLEPFDGALQFISVNAENFAEEISAGLRERELERYQWPPCGSTISSPCHNGGSCFPRLDAFICLCPPHFTGEFCQSPAN